MLSINTNLSSIIAQRSMKQSTNKLNQAIERMTTGAKINHAKDNAANYNIATNMTTKLGALQVAEDNCAMGLDMIATANGTLDQISEKLQRLRDLAVQSSNGTYGSQSKQAINAEANALVDEIERLYNTTEYNGINLMKGQVTGSEESNFIKDIDRRDTSKMITLASVDVSTKLNSGTYSISTPEELAKLATMTNNGLIGEDTEFVLGADIDLSGYANWEPIGIDVMLPDGTRDYSRVFKSAFDGNGYVISELKINSLEKFRGLFGFVYNSDIRNLGLENVIISQAGEYCGALSGDIQYTNISNCYANVAISNVGKTCGGLVGITTARSSIEDCYATGSISNSKQYVGGLSGQFNDVSIIKNSFSEVNISGERLIGGLVGAMTNYTSIYNSYSTGDVIGSGKEVGCLVGLIMNGTAPTTTTNADGKMNIYNCYASGNVSNSTGSIGLISNLNVRVPVEISIQNTFYNGNSVVAYFDFANICQPKCDNVSRIDGNTVLYSIDHESKLQKYSSNLALQVGVNSGESTFISSDININLTSKLSLLKNIGVVNKLNIDYSKIVDSIIIAISNSNIKLGATENRLNSALEEISTQYENLLSSRSTLQDADIAEVSSEYIRQQILQQASATLLSTANQSASIALSLI